MIRNPTRDFLGSGWAFPPRLSSRGEIMLSHEEQDVDEAIRLILGTRKGERPMRPEFGCDLHKLAFQPCDAGTAGLAHAYVTEALARWEPRIDEIEVRAYPDNRNEHCLMIHVSYRIAAINSVRNLVYPFYTIPGED